MGRLVAVYGNPVQLEDALESLRGAGLSDNAEVVGDGYQASNGYSGHAESTHGADGTRHEPREERVVIPAVPIGSSGTPAASPAVLAPVAVPPGGSEAVGVVGPGPGRIDTTSEIERVTGANGDEAGFYADVINGGGSLLVVHGDPSELDRAEAALKDHAGQGMVRH